MNADIDQAATFAEDEDSANQEIKSIEINLNVIKNFFINTVALYECLITKNCKSCNLIESEEFVNLHKNLCEFESIFKVFDVSFNKNLLNNIVKKSVEEIKRSRLELFDQLQVKAEVIDIDDNNEEDKYRCFLNSCNLTYSTEEGPKVHFIKNHCVKGDLFDMVNDDNPDTFVDFSELKRDSEGRYLCEADNCNYASSDRSNFKVHMKRHSGEKKFICFCSKKFFTRDPLMIHFVRLHLKDIEWDMANSDIRSLRKTIRRLTNRKYCFLTSNDDLEDSDSDLTGPVNEDNNVLNEFITQAISGLSTTANEAVCRNVETPIQDAQISHEINQNVMEDEPMNSFNVSINLKDSEFFTDSVTFKSEGVNDDIDDLITKNININDSITTTMAIPSTKDKVVQKEIPQRARKYKCPHKFCRQEFFTTKNLLVHLKASHDPSNPIPCQEEGCAARFKSPALLAQHQKRHRVQYSCSVCSYKTHLAALMTRHNRQHAGEHLFHECSICHEKFEYLGALSTHRRKVHNEVETLVCDWRDCGKKFKTIIGLKKHRRELHLNMRMEFPCDWPDCSAVFTTRTAMTNHMRIHTDERPYQCTWQDCGKWFRLKETLKRHVKLHQGYKPHVCPFDNCDWSFFTKRSMKGHIEKIHLRNSSSKTTKTVTKAEENEEQ